MATPQVLSLDQETIITQNQQSKYYLGDRKAFMKDLQTSLDRLTMDMADPTKESITINGTTIQDKNSPGGLMLIQQKISTLQDLNRTIIQAFDFVKEIEKELRNVVA